MIAADLEVGEVFFIQGHPAGPKLSLVFEKEEDRGMRVHLEGNEQVKALIEKDTEVLRIFEGEIE